MATVFLAFGLAAVLTSAAMALWEVLPRATTRWEAPLLLLTFGVIGVLVGLALRVLA